MEAGLGWAPCEWQEKASCWPLAAAPPPPEREVWGLAYRKSTQALQDFVAASAQAAPRTPGAPGTTAGPPRCCESDPGAAHFWRPSLGSERWGRAASCVPFQAGFLAWNAPRIRVFKKRKQLAKRCCLAPLLPRPILGKAEPGVEMDSWKCGLWN